MSTSFLPRILSVFYAQFDPQHGPMIICQVPESLITSSPAVSSGSAYPSVPPTPSSEYPPSSVSVDPPPLVSRTSSLSLTSPLDSPSPSVQSPHKRGPANKALFNFDDISKYVIPPSPLCGKLVRCHTQKYRILGLPVELKGKYFRNYFRYNLCFVFERTADSSCYEPIVRKISRVLTTCEEESGLLSAPSSADSIRMACEQIYEDLNAYAETSISVDQFNSIELKSFPFFPNPPPIEDWMVPTALIDLSKRIEDNWDLTMVCQHIDGVNHVSRIAQLAECDLALTREAISHLLYYQVIMTIDIFQYSNMYTLRRSIQWLADESHVKEECGPYVVKPGCPVPDWPKLLYLYSRLKPGRSVYEWMKEHAVQSLGIDVRRFTSFGVIKGFLRRVHRWPVYIPASRSPPLLTQSMEGSRTTPYAPVNHTFTPSPLQLSSIKSPMTSSGLPSSYGAENSALLLRGRTQSSLSSPSVATSQPTTPTTAFHVSPAQVSEAYRVRRMSAAERVLEQLRNRDLQRSGTTAGLVTPSGAKTSAWLHRPREENYFVSPAMGIQVTSHENEEGLQRRHSTKTIAGSQRGSMGGSPQLLKPPLRPRLSRSPSAPHILLERNGETQSSFPQDFISLLDGQHHTDELSIKFKVGWPVLEQWLVEAGGSEGSGDYGRVSIIYR